MEWLNYHHLLYFWTVAHEGGITKASEKLHLSQPTISSQLKTLEKMLGAELFTRSGRSLQLTETGQLVLRYADEIFSLGRELREALHGRPTGQPLRFRVGVPDSLSKLVVYRLLKPALLGPEPIKLTCTEDEYPALLSQLAAHDLDLVLSDTPALAGVNIHAFSHFLGGCGIAFFATPELAQIYGPKFPESLNGAPLLLPPQATSLRRNLDQWFDEQDLHPTVRAEFADSALLKVFGKEGLGLFPAPAAIRDEIARQYRVQLVGTIEDLQENYYAISVERRIKHPAVLAISSAARGELFA